MNEDVYSEILSSTYTEAEPELNAQEFIKLVESRRSVRVFENHAIPNDIMNSCLDLALLAPNSSNLQSWGFYWVRSPEKKNELVKACLSQPAAKTAAELIVCVGRTGTWRENSRKMVDILEKTPGASQQAINYYKRLVPLSYTQGFFEIFGLIKKIILFIIGLNKPVVREPTSHSEMKIWAAKTSCLACENLMLALRAYSFDSCPMEGYDSLRIKKILNLPNDAYITMVIGAGKRAKNGIYGPRIRFERSHFIKEV
jgi:nitroreductase